MRSADFFATHPVFTHEEYLAARGGRGDRSPRTADSLPARSIVLYGSLVRGDFWPQQSDIDVMVAGADGSFPALETVNRIEGLGQQLGVKKVEVWAVPERFLIEERQRPFSARASIQFGFHGFDTIAHRRLVSGVELLDGFAVATQPADLQQLARVRVRGLASGDSKRWPDEMSKWACEALKAGQIFFSLQRGLDATRDKRVALKLPRFRGVPRCRLAPPHCWTDERSVGLVRTSSPRSPG